MATLRNVPKNFTFEQQRVEINEIAQDLYDLDLQEQNDIELVDFTVTPLPASGSGSLTYQIAGVFPNEYGEFKFTPPDLSSFWIEDAAKIANWDDAYSWGDHGVEGYITGIGNLSIGALLDVDTTTNTPALNAVLKWNSTKWVPSTDIDTGILYTDLSVVKPNPAANGSGDVTYDNTTGEFTYTPPELSNFATKVSTDDNAPSTPYDGQMWWKSDEGKLKIYYEDVDSGQWVDALPAGIQLGDISVVTDNVGTNLALSYDDSTGVLTFTPGSGGGGGSSIDLTAFSVDQKPPGTASLTYDDQTGEFSYTPPNLSSYLTGLPAHYHTLVGLTDTDLLAPNAPNDGEVLTYNANDQKWRSTAIPTDNNTTYTQSILAGAGSVQWDLTPSIGVANSITITAGTNISLDQVSASGFRINSTGGSGQTLTTEEVQDIVGQMVDGGTETRMTVTYDDVGGKLNFIADQQATTAARPVHVPEVDKTATSSGAVYTNNDETITFPNSGSNMWKDVKFNKLDNDKVYEFRYQGYSTGSGSYNGFYFTDKQSTRIDAATTQSGTDKISDHLSTAHGTEKWFAVNIDTQGGGDTGTYVADQYGADTWNWPANGLPWDPNDTNGNTIIADWHFVIDMPRKKIWVRQYTESYHNGKYWSKWRCNTADQGTEACDPTDPTSQSSFYLRETGTGDYYFNFGCFVEAGGQGQCIVKAIDPMYSAFRDQIAGPAGQDGTPGADGAADFLALTDTPSTFTADKWLKVNTGGTALEWVDEPNSVDLTAFSVVKPNPTASGSGDVTYDNTTGEFTYTPPVIPGNITYDLTASDGSVVTEEKILLSGSDNSEDAVTLAVDANSDLTITRANNKITFGGGGSAQVQSDWNASGTLGEILNKPTVPVNLNDLNNVNTTPSDGDVLKWEQSTSTWIASADIVGSGGGGSSDPVGTIVAWAGGSNNLPTGYQLCDGTAASTAELIAVTGANVPDLRDRFIIGAGGSWGTNDFGGSKDAVVVEHTHTSNLDGGGVFPGLGNNTLNYGGAGQYPYTANFTINNEGVDGTDKNLPPYWALCYVIKHTAASIPPAGIQNVVEDTTPQLGGDLDANGNIIDMGANTITDTKVGEWDQAASWGDHSTEGYLKSHPGEVNVQSDWNQGDTAADDYIKNKPTNVSHFTNDAGYVTTSGENNVQSSWTVTDTSHDAYIQNKPTNVSDFTNDAGYVTVSGDANVQSDWNVTDNSHDAYIANKPTNLSSFTNDQGFVTSDTTYTFSAIDGSQSDMKVLRLLTGAGVSAGDVILIEGDNISFTRSGNSLTIDSTATATAASIPSGSTMLFVQSAAPTGWTTSSAHNNKALRIVSSGGGGTGGTVNFTAAFTTHSVSGNTSFTVSNQTTDNATATGTVNNQTSSGTVNGGGGGNTNYDNNNSNTGDGGGATYSLGHSGYHTLVSGELPSHSHNFHRTRYATAAGGGGDPGAEFGTMPSGAWSETNTQNHGSGVAHRHTQGQLDLADHTHPIGYNHRHGLSDHSHGLTMNSHNHSFTGSAHNHDFDVSVSNATVNLNDIDIDVAYVDAIICTKD